MKIDRATHRKKGRDEWHWRFAWLPVRVSPTRLVWWEWYYCRTVCDDEGCWAGGYKWHWQVIENGESKPFDYPVVSN